MTLLKFIKDKIIGSRPNLPSVDDSTGLVLEDEPGVFDRTLLEQYRLQKKKEQAYESSPNRILGMSPLEYIRYRNPSSLEELNQILTSLWIADIYDIIKVYSGSSDNEYPHYIGVKVRVHYPNGSTLTFPPGREVIEIPRDSNLIKSQTLMVKHRRTTS